MRTNYERGDILEPHDIAIILVAVIIAVLHILFIPMKTEYKPVMVSTKTEILTIDTTSAPLGFVEEGASEEYKQAVIQYKLKLTKNHKHQRNERID